MWLGKFEANDSKQNMNDKTTAKIVEIQKT